MSVNPGFGGQKFMPEVLDKIKELKKIREQKKLDFDIEIDGGINFDNCKSAIDAGANILVSGTTVFKSNDGDKRARNWSMTCSNGKLPMLITGLLFGMIYCATTIQVLDLSLRDVPKSLPGCIDHFVRISPMTK